MIGVGVYVCSVHSRYRSLAKCIKLNLMLRKRYLYVSETPFFSSFYSIGWKGIEKKIQRVLLNGIIQKREWLGKSLRASETPLPCTK